MGLNDDVIRRLERRAIQVKRSADRIVSDSVKRGGEVLLSGSPVRTGRFRGNWAVVDAGSEPPVDRFATARELEDVTEGDGPGARSEEMFQKAANDLEDKAEQIQAGDRVDIANATPYAGDLEDGTSRQAPAGVLIQARQAVEVFFASRKVLE